VIVNDRMQQGYVYDLTAPMGRKFDPGFEPQLTPAQMLALGVFGGKYNARLNFFGVRASQPLAVWRAKGWIRDEDPRGWFQWYCRYYMGRRSEDDARQIARWRAIRRHVTQLRRSCLRGDLGCRPRQRQALLHWAYDSRVL
jgi:hypothetical protein